MISLHWVASLSLAEAAHYVHLPCGLAVLCVPYPYTASTLLDHHGVTIVGRASLTAGGGLIINSIVYL